MITCVIGSKFTSFLRKGRSGWGRITQPVINQYFPLSPPTNQKEVFSLKQGECNSECYVMKCTNCDEVVSAMHRDHLGHMSCGWVKGDHACVRNTIRDTVRMIPPKDRIWIERVVLAS